MSEPIQVVTGDGQLSTIATQVNTILNKQNDMAVDIAIIKEQHKAVPDHEARIRALESKAAKMVGAGVASGVLSGGMATIIYWALSHH